MVRNEMLLADKKKLRPINLQHLTSNSAIFHFFCDWQGSVIVGGGTDIHHKEVAQYSSNKKTHGVTYRNSETQRVYTTS